MTQLARNTCAVMRLPDEPADRIELIPVGHFKTDDARAPFILDDPAAVITRSLAAAPGGKLLIDFDHRSVPVGDERPDTRAAGWITALDVEGDRIVASVEWTPEGRAALEGRAYRFISPTFRNLPDRRVVLIDGAGLVNTPALPQLRQLASKNEDHPHMDLLEELARLLGISADEPAEIIARVRALAATENQMASIVAAAGVQTGPDAARQVCARLTSSAPDPAQFVPMASFTALQTQFASLQKSLADDRVEQALGLAREEGKLVPADEEWVRQLATKDLALFEQWRASAPVRVNVGQRQLAGKQPPKVSNDELDPLERQVAARMGVSPADYLKQRAAMQED